MSSHKPLRLALVLIGDVPALVLVALVLAGLLMADKTRIAAA